MTVSVGKSGDSATEGTDYPAVQDFDITIAKGSKTGTGTFKVIPNADKKGHGIGRDDLDRRQRLAPYGDRHQP